MKYVKLIKSLFLLFVGLIGLNENLIAGGGGCAPPATNDNCTDAIALVVNAPCVNGTTCDGTSEDCEEGNCGASYDQSVWYSWVATSATHTVIIDQLAGSCFLGTAIWNGSGGCVPLPGALLSCEDMAGGPDPQEHSLSGLGIGNTYYVQIVYSTFGPCGDETTFCILVDDTTSISTCTGGETCASACDILLDGTCYSGTLEGAVDNLTGTVGCQSGGNPEVWFAVFPDSNFFSITVSNLGAGFTGNIEITLFQGGCGSLGEASSLCGSAPLTLTDTVIPGEPYYVIISSSLGENAANTTFDICVTQSMVQNDCTNNGTCVCADICFYEQFNACMTSTLEGASNCVSNQGCQSGNNDNVAYYGYPSSDSLYITVDQLGCEFTGDVEVVLWEGPCIGLSNMQSLCGPAPFTATFGVCPGKLYFWFIASSNNENTVGSTFSICVGDGLPCAASCGTGGFTVTHDSTDVTCFGGNDGTATVTPTGGASPFTYLWDDPGNQTDSTATGLTAGTYTVTITDASNCSTTESVTINEPPALTTSTDSTNITCNGICDGIATVTPSGGTASYTYLWSNGQTDSTATGLCAGTTDTVIVTDANGCTDTTFVSLSEPALLTSSISDSANINCNGVCDGTATVTPQDGTAPYAYLWSNGQTDSTATGLCAGTTDTVIVTDANGCTDTAFVSLSEPALLTSSISDSTNINCNGVCDGIAIVTPQDGTAPYAYLWSNGQTDSTATGLCAGTTDTVIVTDANGCTDTTIVSLSEPIALTSSITDSTNITCNGVCDGIAIVTPQNGTAPYAYLWSNGQIDSTATGLCAGTADTVIVTDANGCTDTTFVTLSEPLILISSITDNTNITCNGLCDGIATVTPTGGTLPYTYLWNNGQTDSTATGLCAGTTDTVVVTDVNGCIDTAYVSLSEPLVLTSSITDSTNISCNGLCDGTATVTPQDGTAPYAYLWSNGQTDSTATGLCAGTTDTVIVTDANGCTDTTFISLSEPIVLTSSITDSTNLICNGVCDGIAIVTPQDGTAPYAYLWNNGQPDSTATGLCAGTTDTVIVTDANGCADTSFVSLSEPAALTLAITDTNEANCGLSDGSATVTPSGGVSPYTYLWNDPLSQTDSIADSLSAANYTVIVTDANGCIDSVSVNINNIGGGTASITDTTHVLCNGDSTGSATVTPVGGASPYAFSWDDPGAQTDSIATGLTAGTYTATVTDNAGCIALATVTITQPPALNLPTTNVPVSCNGDSTGSATVTPSGGAPPYAYLWNPAAGGQTDSTATGLPAGTFTVTVTDNNGCVDSTTATISQPASPLSLIITGLTDVFCNGDSTGSAIVTPSGGTNPYTYSWNDTGSQTDSTATGLPAGTFTVIVTDNNGCVDSTSVIITQPASPLSLIITGLTDVLCNGDSTGSAIVTPSGGTNPYTYSWNDTGSQTDSTATGLPAGTFTVIVTDSNGCVDSTTATISQPASPLSFIIIGLTDVLCNGDSTGSAIVTPSGGTNPYTYSWNDPDSQTDSTATGLPAGTFTVIVTDSNGCVDSTTATISQPASPLSFIITGLTDVLCNGDSTGSATVTPSGGTPPYIYVWSDTGAQTDSTATGLPAGTFTVIVTDSNGCVDSTTATISQPASPLSLIITGLSDVLCNSDSTGSATVTPSGGTTPYLYSWNDPGSQTDSIATGLPAGTFTVIVTDANGCSDSASAAITEPASLTLVITDTNDANCGLSDGSATVTPSGGVSPYTYLWNDPQSQTDSIADSLSAGNYTVIVTDSNGCIDSVSININNIGGGTASITDTTHVLCNGDSTGSATVTPVGGASPYTFLWDDPGAQTDSIATGLAAGTYTATVTDSAGCIVLAIVVITQPAATLSLIITGLADVLCNSDSTGSATVTPSGGTTPYLYSWNDPGSQTDSIATGLPAGTFTVVITDAYGCTETDSVIITEPSALTLTTGSQDASCGANDGLAWVVVTGGTGPYSYLWNDSFIQTTDTAFNLSFGTYTVTVTDSNGCIDSAATTVNEIGAPVITIDSVTNVSCNGGSDGAIYITVSGGTLPYTYTWSSTDTTEDINNLTDGTYIITIIDSNGCTTMNSAAVSEPPAIFLLLSSTDAACNNNDGTATVSIQSGGNPPYSFLWNPTSQTTTTATGLQGGAYSVEVTDSSGCSVTGAVSVNNIGSPVISLTITDESCPGESDGAVDLIVTGGTMPYAYLWSNSDTTEDINNLTAGTYIIIVTDNNNCVKEDTAIVNSDTGNDCEEWQIYSGITPNGFNPVWVIKGLEPFKPVKVILFNRWGDVVWKSDNYNNDWAGTNMKGKPLPDGVYFYVVVKANGEEDKGWVNIAR